MNSKKVKVGKDNQSQTKVSGEDLKSSLKSKA
jgi:hypothetical protein